VQHPAIREAAVLCRDDSPGGKRLVTYVVPLGAPSNPFPHPLPLPEGEGGELTAGALRRWLRTKLPEYMLPSAVVTLDSLPLTSHHKLDWEALPAPDQESRQGRRAFAPPPTPAERALVDIWTKLLNVAQVGIHDNFFELGGDSNLSIQVIARAREAGLRFAPKQLFEHQTIAELAAVEGTCQTIDAEQGPIAGEAPLTPIQHWFLDDDPIDPQHFNQAVLLEVGSSARAEWVAAALDQLCLHHDALRLRFERGAAGWRQHHAPHAAWPLTTFDLSAVAPADQAAAIRKTADGLQAGMNLAEGPLAVAGWFDLGAGRDKRLLLAVHHLAIDAVSWRILLEDLATVHQQLARGLAPALPPKTTSFQALARRLNEWARNESLRDEAPFWLESARRRVLPLPRDLPRDLPGADNRCEFAREVTGSLDAGETTALVERVPAVYRTEINDVLLTALAWTLAEWTGDSRSLVDLESHGRSPLFDDVDLSRTVGWCTHYYPLCLSSPPGLTAGELLRRTKNALRRVPQGGAGYGALRYLEGGEIAEKLRGLPRAELSFNYLGRFGDLLSSGGPFALAQGPCGAPRSPRAERRHLLEINAHISGGRLQVAWTYGERIHRRETIERLAESFLKNLRALIAHCSSDEAGGAAPEDFPLADLNRQSMDQVARLLDQLDLGE
jgi:non-ribosomal peptide synthase protein (TIGR01720 family)